MRSSRCWRSLRLTAVLSTALFSSACVTDEQRINRAAAARAEGALVGQALAVGADLPELPGDCRAHERAGVTAADRWDTALVKYDRAVERGNARIDRCADWYDALEGTGD